MSKQWMVGAGLLVAVSALAGCDDEAPVTPGGTGGLTAGSTAGTGTGTSGTGGTTVGATTTGTGTGGTSATTSGTGTTSTTGVMDSGAGTTGDLSVGDDPLTPGHDGAGKVACGAAVACPAGEVCCGMGFGMAGCAASCDAAAMEAVTGCDGKEDCGAGEFCCSGLGTPTVCAPACGSGAAAEQATPLCHTEQDCPNPDLALCDPGNSFTWWGFCG